MAVSFIAAAMHAATVAIKDWAEMIFLDQLASLPEVCTPDLSKTSGVWHKLTVDVEVEVHTTFR